MYSKLTSQTTSLTVGYIYMTGFGVFLYKQGFYDDSTIFTWGVPVVFMGKKIEDEYTYYTILLLLFVHQLLNSWLSDTVYPWIVNNVQNRECRVITYPKTVSLCMINLFDMYSQFDMILLIAGTASQIPFLLAVLAANLVTSTIVNLSYMREKEYKVIELEEILITDSTEPKL